MLARKSCWSNFSTENQKQIRVKTKSPGIIRDFSVFNIKLYYLKI